MLKASGPPTTSTHRSIVPRACAVKRPGNTHNGGGDMHPRSYDVIQIHVKPPLVHQSTRTANALRRRTRTPEPRSLLVRRPRPTPTTPSNTINHTPHQPTHSSFRKTRPMASAHQPGNTHIRMIALLGPRRALATAESETNLMSHYPEGQCDFDGSTRDQSLQRASFAGGQNQRGCKGLLGQ